MFWMKHIETERPARGLRRSVHLELATPNLARQAREGVATAVAAMAADLYLTP